MSRRSPSGRYLNWPEIIDQARAVPGVWQVLLPDEPERLVTHIRYKRHPLLRRDDGHLEARVAHVYTSESGSRRGNVSVRWVPHMITGGVHTDKE